MRYLLGMTKTVKAEAGKLLNKSGEATIAVVRDSKTGQFVTVKGVAALKHGDLKIKKGLSLTKPIAQQALSPRTEKRKAG